MRLFGLLFGSSSRAAALVLGVFMGGLALGGAWARWRRFGRALLAYGWLEALSALLALLSLPALRALPPLYGAWVAAWGLGPSAALLLRALLAAALILPPCVSAGMTLPVLC